jgi:protein-S-isoprenylcysteine O-methyltransferase
MTIYGPQIVGSLWGVSELFLMLTRRSKFNAVSKDRHSLGLIWVVALAAITLGIVAAYRLPACRLPHPKLVAEIGAGLFVAGVVLRWYAIIHLGRFFTTNVAIAADHRVVDTGPYRWLRHPSYTGALVAEFGFGLTFQNWASLLLIVVPCCAVTMWRIHIEEAALTETLGEAYRDYQRRTKRLIPWIY